MTTSPLQWEACLAQATHSGDNSSGKMGRTGWENCKLRIDLSSWKWSILSAVWKTKSRDGTGVEKGQTKNLWYIVGGHGHLCIQPIQLQCHMISCDLRHLPGDIIILSFHGLLLFNSGSQLLLNNNSTSVGVTAVYCNLYAADSIHDHTSVSLTLGFRH